MRFVDVAVNHYFEQIPIKKKFGGFGASVISGKNLSLKMKEASMHMLAFSLLSRNMATEALQDLIDSGILDKDEKIAELRAKSGFRDDQERTPKPLTFDRSQMPTLSLETWELRWLGGLALRLSTENRDINENDDTSIQLIAHAVIWGLLVGLEFVYEGTEILRVWIDQSTFREFHQEDEFFVPAPGSLRELTDKSVLLYHMWKAS